MEFGKVEPHDKDEYALDVVAWSIFWRCFLPLLLLIPIAGVVIESIFRSIVSILSDERPMIGLYFTLDLSWMAAVQTLAVSFVAFGVFRFVLEDRIGKPVRGAVLVLRNAPPSSEPQRS